MKKALALLWALLMVFSLFACSGGSSNADPSPTGNTPASPPAGSPSASPSVAPSVDEADASPSPEKQTVFDGSGTAGDGITNFTATSGYGFYDKTYDYTQEKTMKIGFIINNTTFIHQIFADSFTTWAEKFNCEFEYYSTNRDSNLFMTQMETLAGQGYDGFFLDPDNQTWPRTSELCDELDVDWMPVMQVPYDVNNELNHPISGFDNYTWGVDQANYCMAWLEATYPDYDVSEVGLIGVNFSIDNEINQRFLGAYDTFIDKYGDDANFYPCDLISMQVNAESAYNMVSATVSAAPNYKYWLVCSTIDDFAVGSVRVFEENGLGDVTCIVSAGGDSLMLQWDEGNQSCWKAANYMSQLFTAEHLFGALYTFMAGWCTAEDIWPDYIGNGEKYARLTMCSFMIEHDTYTEYQEFIDSYTGFDLHDYPYNGTTFKLLFPPTNPDALVS